MNPLNLGEMLDFAYQNYNSNFFKKIFCSSLIYGFLFIFSISIILFVNSILTPFILDITANDIVAESVIIIIMWTFIAFLLIFTINFDSLFMIEENIKESFKKTHKVLFLSIFQFFLFFFFSGFIIGIAFIFGFLQNFFFYIMAFLSFLILKVFTSFSIPLIASNNKYFYNSFKKALELGFLKSYFFIILYNFSYLGIYIFFINIYNFFIFNIEFQILNIITTIILQPLSLFSLFFISFLSSYIFMPKINLSFYSFLKKIKPSNTPIISRIFAGIIDNFICFLFIFFINIILSYFILNYYFNIFSPLFQIRIIYFISHIIILILYNIYFDIFESGQTPGKKIMNLKVISIDNKNIRFFQSLLRNSSVVLDIFSGILLIIFSKDRETIGDLISKTQVKRID